ELEPGNHASDDARNAVSWIIDSEPGAAPPQPKKSHYEDTKTRRSQRISSCLRCSLTSCCYWLGESPNNGRFLVRPYSLTPNAAWQQAASKAGVTMYLRRRGEEHMTSSRRSQSGGLGKHTGRTIKRTMQPRKQETPSDIAGRDGRCGWRLARRSRKPGIAVRVQREGAADPPG